MTGGCGTLAPAYLKMVASCKRNRGRGVETSVINSYQNQGGRKTAYIDPNDPSVIYLQQPEVAQNINYNPWGYQPIPQSEPMQIHPNQIPPPQQPPNVQPAPQPNINYPQPNNNYSQPNNNYSQPNNNYSQPNNNYSQPNNNYSQPNNNYPNFDDFHQNAENELPSEEELYNSQNRNNNNQQPVYPNQGMGGLNNVIDNQQQQGGKYFGFFGPSLERNPNNNGQ